jgi:hypothetical protein
MREPLAVRRPAVNLTTRTVASVHRCVDHACGPGGCEPGEQQRLYRDATGRAPVVAPAIVHDVIRSPGEGLPPSLAATMSARFGHDFSRVRVHRGPRAADSAASVAARAYTVGPHVVLGRPVPDLGSAAGQRILAHELAHVLQQPAVVPAGPLPVSDPHDPAEREAADAATRTVRTSAGASVQRDPESGAGVPLHVVTPEDLRRMGIDPGVLREDDENLQTPARFYGTATVTDLDRHTVEHPRVADVRSSAEYVDNGLVSVGARTKNLMTLEITAVNLRYRGKPDLLIPIGAIGAATAQADHFIRVRHVVYPAGPTGAITYNELDTPNIVAAAAVKQSQRADLLDQREFYARIVYAFAGLIAQLGHAAASAQNTGKIPPARLRPTPRVTAQVRADRQASAARADAAEQLAREMDKLIEQTDLTPKHPPLVDPTHQGKP